MGLQITKTTGIVYKPIFLKILEDIPGGVTLSVGDAKAATEEIKAGTLIGEDAVSGLYHICKSAEVYADGDGEDKTIQVLKNHEFKVDDFICNEENSSKITAIDTTNSDYDIITVTNGYATIDGEVLYQGTSEGLEAADIVQKYIPKGITKYGVALITYSKSGKKTEANVTVGVVVRGTVKESLLPYPVPIISKTALTAIIRFA